MESLMANTSTQLYDIIMDTIDANEDLTVCEVIYILERIKHELMIGVDKSEKQEKKDDEPD
jgi:hypothetical protein